MSMMTVTGCFAELQPGLDEVARLIRTAPLPKNERSGLALLYAIHAFGVVATSMGKDPEAATREVCDIIVDAMRNHKPTAIAVVK